MVHALAFRELLGRQLRRAARVRSVALRAENVGQGQLGTTDVD